MKNIRRLVALGTCAVASLAAVPATAQASGGWQYNQDAESCLAVRRFDTGDGPVAFRLRSFGPGSAIEAMVVSPQVTDEPASVHPVELGWDGEEGVLDQLGLLGAANRIPTVTVLVAHRPVSAWLYYDQGMTLFSRLDPASESVRLRVVGDPPIELQTGSLEEPLARLEECEAGLMEKWGWGADYSQRVATAPVPDDPQSWFYKTITYPAVQLLNHVSSILQVRLKVDRRGRVAECVVQSSPGSPLFGSKNCERIRDMGRFTPAVDAQGQPVDGYMQLSITFAQYD